MPDGSGSLIIGTIHTHPDSDPNMFQRPTINDSGLDDFSSLEQLGGKKYNIFGYVVSTDKDYKYYFDYSGNKIIEDIGFRTDYLNCP
jgi:hypothetical protein